MRGSRKFCQRGSNSDKKSLGERFAGADNGQPLNADLTVLWFSGDPDQYY